MANFNAFNRLFGKVIVDSISRAINISVADLISQTAARASSEAAASMSEFARSYPVIARKRRKELANANNLSAFRAQQAIIASYRSTNHPTPSGYRQNDGRFSGGALLDALSDSAFFRADSDEVNFINESLLDRRAAHWYRLNFGVGGSNVSRVEEPLFFFGVQSGLSLGWTARRPSPSYIMPAGFWVNNQFAPGNFYAGAGSSRSRSVKAKGFQGQGFLEPGIAVLARELPLGIERVITIVTEEAIEAGGDYWSGRSIGGRSRIRVKNLRNITGL